MLKGDDAEKHQKVMLQMRLKTLVDAREARVINQAVFDYRNGELTHEGTWAMVAVISELRSAVSDVG